MSAHDQRAHEALTGLDAGDPAHRDAMTVPADPLAAAERRGYLRGLEAAHAECVMIANTCDHDQRHGGAMDCADAVMDLIHAHLAKEPPR